MIKLRLLFLLMLLLSLASCVPPVQEPPMTQMEIRVAQTREFDTENTKLVMKTMMNVLQDEGYIIKNAVLDLGLLTAEKQLNVENKQEVFFAKLAMGDTARWNKHQTLEASANVSEFGNQTRVRVNFQVKTYDNVGCISEVVDVKNPEIYQVFFTKVHKGIFLQKEGL